MNLFSLREKTILGLTSFIIFLPFLSYDPPIKPLLFSNISIKAVKNVSIRWHPPLHSGDWRIRPCPPKKDRRTWLDSQCERALNLCVFRMIYRRDGCRQVQLLLEFVSSLCITGSWSLHWQYVRLYNHFNRVIFVQDPKTTVPLSYFHFSTRVRTQYAILEDASTEGN